MSSWLENSIDQFAKKIELKVNATECSLNSVFPRISKFLRPPLRAAIGRTKNGQPTRVTVYTLISRTDKLRFYMQRMGCSELGKTHFLMNTLYVLFIADRRT